MAELKVVLFKKNGNQSDQMNPATTDERVAVTAENAKLPEGINSLEDLIAALGGLAFEDYVAINVSDESNFGVVKISSTDSEATDTVPTSKVLHDGLSGKMNTTGNETVTGVKAFTDGVKVGNQNISYDSNTDTVTYGAPLPSVEEEETP